MLHRVPLLRCLLPLAIGIFIADSVAMPLWTVVALLCTVLAALLFAEWFVSRSPKRAMHLSFLPTSLLLLLCTLVGALSVSIHRPASVAAQSLSDKPATCRIERITDRESSTELIAKETASGVLLQIFLDHKNYSLTEGDVITFSARFHEIANLGNPEEFDYRTFMMRRGCTLSTSLGSDEYRTIRHTEDFNSLSLHARRRLVNLVINSSLSVHAKRLVCTAVLGDASFADSTTRNAFSRAGIAHMLAISGLHTGIILALLTLLLRPLDFMRLRKVRWLVTVIALFSYIFVTGMSASAVRAAIMAATAIAALAWQRDGSPLNSLCLAAILILVFTPIALFDVGFQLSFAAVTAILLLAARLNVMSQRRRIAFTVISWILATLIANLGCALLSAHYFHTLPLLSILSNLIVIPILPLFVAIALAAILCLSFGIELIELHTLLEWLTSFINGTAHAASHLPFAYIDNIHISMPVIVIYYAAFALAVSFIYSRRIRDAIGFLTVGTVLVMWIAIEAAMVPRSGLFILNSHNSTPLLYFSGGNGQLWCADREWTPDEFTDAFQGLLAKYRINHITIAVNPPESAAVMCHRRIVMAASTSMRYQRAAKPVRCDYLVVTNRYYGNISDLLHTYEPSMIVLSGALFDNCRDRYAVELASLPRSIRVHDIATSGAVVVQ